MNRYIYAFRLEPEDGEIFFRFPQFPEIISSILEDDIKSMPPADIQSYACDAVIAALQARITTKGEIPISDDLLSTKQDGFVILTVHQAMKIELFKLYKDNCNSVSELARKIKKQETVTRRLLDLYHASKSTEIEAAIEVFGKTLSHFWSLESTPEAPTKPIRKKDTQYSL